MFNYFYKRLLSFYYAIKGILDLFAHHPNAQIHFVAALVVLSLSLYLQLPLTELAILVICIVLVISMEAMNSAVEYLADKISPENDPIIGKAKDIAAAAVLISAMGAAVVGSLILLPYFLN